MRVVQAESSEANLAGYYNNSSESRCCRQLEDGPFKLVSRPRPSQRSNLSGWAVVAFNIILDSEYRCTSLPKGRSTSHAQTQPGGACKHDKPPSVAPSLSAAA